MKNITAIILSLLVLPTGAYMLRAQTETFHPATSSFKWIRTVHGQSQRPYSDDFAAFYEAGKWGYEDVKGNVVIPAEYEEVKDFSNGLAIVKKDGKWGVITPTGREVFKCIYDTIAPFSNNVALAAIDKSWYYINSNGKVQGLPSDMTFHSYSNGLARVKKKVRGQDRYGYIDSRGFFVIEPIFDQASDFFGEKALVTINGRHFSINAKGKRQALDFPFTADNIYLSNNYGSGFLKQGEKYFFIKYEKGRYSLLPSSYTKVSAFQEGVALVQTSNGRLKYIRPNGTTAVNLPEECTAAGNFSEGKAWVCINGKYGFINPTGKIIIDTIFSYTSDFNDGLAYVAYGGRQGIIRQSYANETWPDLRIESVTLADHNGNGKVESGEKFLLNVELKNYGKEPVEKASITLSGEAEQAMWFNYASNSINVPRIMPGETTTVSFEGQSNLDLVSEDINVSFKALADNQFLATNSSMSFPALGINQCEPLLANYWVHTPDHSVIAPGKSALVEFAVINEGSDIAKDVTVTMRWPSGINASASVIRLGDINPGDTKEYKQTFYLDTTVSTSGQLSIVATVTDYTKKHTDVKYMMFETGKMNLAVNVLGGGSAYSMPAYMAQAQQVSGASGVPETTSPSNVSAPAAGSVQQSELLSGLTRIKDPDNNKFALVIGNEDYNSFKQQTLYEPNVDFAVSDAETFSEYAKNILGVPENNIILLKNATYSQMNFNINKISRIASLNPGQVEIYVYYAGHGQVDGSSKDCFLIPVDVSTTSPAEGIRLEDMYATLSESGAKRTMVFLDACYSGVGRGIIIQPKETPIKGNLVVMTASSATQRSMPYQEKQHGMFTYFLLKQLKDTYGDITIQDLYDAVKAKVQSSSVWINNMEQTPELLSGPGIENNWKQWKP